MAEVRARSRAVIRRRWRTLRSPVQELRAVAPGSEPFPADLARIRACWAVAPFLRRHLATRPLDHRRNQLLCCHVRRRVRKRKTNMPVLVKFYGIVIRRLIHRTFGTHFHAFYGDSELVIGLNPLRVIQGEAPPWVREWALDWVGHYQSGLRSAGATDQNVATPISPQAAGQLVFAD